jgi:hypothetical protein
MVQSILRILAIAPLVPTEAAGCRQCRRLAAFVDRLLQIVQRERWRRAGCSMAEKERIIGRVRQLRYGNLDAKARG